MKSLLRLSAAIDTLTDKLGRASSWLVLLAILVGSGNATIRYLFHVSSNAWLEMQWYLISAVFLICGAYALRHNQHVRVDVLSSHWSPKTRARVDILGTLLLLFPVCLLVVQLSWTVFMDAYRSGEVSTNANGLILWPARLLVPVGFTLLIVQGLSELIKRICFLTGLISDPAEKAQEISAEEQLAQEIQQQRGAAQ